MSEILPLPCPFCGGPAWEASSMFPDATEWQRKNLIVRCANTKCPGFECEVNKELWNTRRTPIVPKTDKMMTDEEYAADPYWKAAESIIYEIAEHHDRGIKWPCSECSGKVQEILRDWFPDNKHSQVREGK